VPLNTVTLDFFPISSGTICNFNQDASKRLAPFEAWVTGTLSKSPVLHADETGINVDGKRHWLISNSALKNYMK